MKPPFAFTDYEGAILIKWLTNCRKKPSLLLKPPDILPIFYIYLVGLLFLPLIIISISLLSNVIEKGFWTEKSILEIDQRFAIPSHVISVSSNLILITVLSIPTALSYVVFLYRKPARRYYALPTAAILLLFASLLLTFIAELSVFYMDNGTNKGGAPPEVSAGIGAFGCCVASITCIFTAYLYLGISAYMTQVAGKFVDQQFEDELFPISNLCITEQISIYTIVDLDQSGEHCKTDSTNWSSP